ncbi:hypothetical protein C8Q73DRAFT_788469 [Cubamyces lactineus]|nr:hypothetical protein C8Q73DRAFT_788469 [Cubamyces lactineus]
MPGLVADATRIWEVNLYWPLHAQCGVWDPKGKGVDVWECIRPHQSTPGTQPLLALCRAQMIVIGACYKLSAPRTLDRPRTDRDAVRGPSITHRHHIEPPPMPSSCDDVEDDISTPSFRASSALPCERSRALFASHRRCRAASNLLAREPGAHARLRRTLGVMRGKEDDGIP